MARTRSRLLIGVVTAVSIGLGLGAAVARAQAPDAAHPKLWTVVVTVGQYSPPLPARPGLIPEGRRLARWAAETAGWGRGNVLELNDLGDPFPTRGEARTNPLKPTRENLDWAFGEWLGKRVQPGDVVLFTFAGRAAATPRGAVLLPGKARPDDLAGSGWLPDQAIEGLLRDHKCSAVFCVIDAPLVAPAGSAAGATLLGRLSRWPGASVWLSTSARPANGEGGSAFAIALRTALGDARRALLSVLATLDQDPTLEAGTFRQRGGFSAELVLHHDLLRLPQTRWTGPLVQNGHADRVTTLAVRADSRTLATASADSTIRLWRVDERGQALLRVIPAFLNEVTSLAFSGDGRFLAGGDGMGTVLVIDLDTPDAPPIGPAGPKAHTKRVETLVFLCEEGQGEPRSRQLVSLDQEGRCTHWNLTEGRLRFEPEPFLEGVLRLAVATRPGGPSAFAAIGEDGKLRAFDRARRPADR
jgi:hypothetical protein